MCSLFINSIIIVGHRMYSVYKVKVLSRPTNIAWSIGRISVAFLWEGVERVLNWAVIGRDCLVPSGCNGYLTKREPTFYTSATLIDRLDESTLNTHSLLAFLIYMVVHP